MMTVPFGKPSDPIRMECLNWEDKFPYKPEVSFRMWHDSDRLYIEYTVLEETTRAEQTELGGFVYQDSCVEFFIQPEPDHDPHYYNFEWNAAGQLYLAYRTGRNDPEHAPLSVLQSVEVFPSEGRAPFGEKALGRPWTLRVAIPATALFKSGITSWSGCKMKMNLYKCGDALKTSHYLTWAPISTPDPDYHRPEFFREVVFE